MPRLRRVAFLLVFVFALSAQTLYAQWPTTCIGLNDALERDLGNYENVGIYQRVFGADAEAACQRDHRDDVRGVFAWAFRDTPPAPVTTPGISTETPPRIDPGLQEAWNLLDAIELGTWLKSNPNGRTVIVRFDPTLPDFLDAAYAPNRNAISVNPELLSEKPQTIAIIIAHELWHAVSTIEINTIDRCVADEVWALLTALLIWGELWGWEPGIPAPQTQIERNFTHEYNLMISEGDGGKFDFDEDVSDWPVMLDYVTNSLGYPEFCASQLGIQESTRTPALVVADGCRVEKWTYWFRHEIFEIHHLTLECTTSGITNYFYGRCAPNGEGIFSKTLEWFTDDSFENSYGIWKAPPGLPVELAAKTIRVYILEQFGEPWPVCKMVAQ